MSLEKIPQPMDKFSSYCLRAAMQIFRAPLILLTAFFALSVLSQQTGAAVNSASLTMSAFVAISCRLTLDYKLSPPEVNSVCTVGTDFSRREQRINVTTIQRAADVLNVIF